MASDTLAKRFLISGRVQGVGYRYFAERAASRLSIRGYAKNLSDGRVEVYAIGTTEQLNELAGKLKRGPIMSRVERVDENAAEILAKFAGDFTIESEN